MKFSTAWLNELIDLSSAKLDTSALVTKLTMAGLEVAQVTPVANQFSGVVVGEIIEVSKHPNADKLTVCLVAVGEATPLQIVCGAMAFTFGSGLTIIVSLAIVPTQVDAVGVMTKITMPGVVSGSVKVWEGIVAVVPLALNPVMPSGLEPVQLKVVPATFEVSAMLLVGVPLQTV